MLEGYGVDANDCSEIYVRALVEAEPGTWITNTAVIASSSDLNTEDNFAWWDGWVNEPHTNLSIDKEWNWGALVPGGELRYNIYFDNNGNQPVSGPIFITDTLPTGTRFVGVNLDNPEPSPVTFVMSTTDYVVWQYGDLPNGYGVGFEVVLEATDAEVDDVLVNTVEISPQPEEDSYDDNISAWVETLYDHGANLRVDKRGWWEDEARWAHYQLKVENVGDEPVYGVTITDTYPADMTFNGDNIGIDFWRPFTITHNEVDNQILIELQALDSKEMVWIDFGTQTGEEPPPPGLIYTNEVVVTEAPEEVTWEDNYDELTLTTGPDLWVEKELVAGELLPGELITFSLLFGNSPQDYLDWWNLQGQAWMTDTLPAELEYVSAEFHWCEEGPWCPVDPTFGEGNELIWELWQIGAGQWNEIRLTVRITDTVDGLDTFTNWVEIASDQPISDTEPYTEDNSDSLYMEIDLPYYEVSKVYESSRVAGTGVTYTITVDNPGNAEGTNVVLNDTVPAGVTYSGGNTFTDVFASIPAGGGTETTSFNATLTCSLTGITNDDYQVADSLGVSSEIGSPVSFNTITPTISAEIAQSLAIVDETAYLTGTGSTNGTSLTYTWDLGDGSITSGPLASHVFTDTGVYTLILTVTDACDYYAVQTALLEVETATSYIYLPLILR